MSRYERRHEHRRFHDYDASYDRDDITFAPPPSAAPRRSPAAVAVVGYQRPGSGHAPRDRDRDRDRDGGGGGRFTDRERDNLKRRLSIPDPGALRPHRARSLSLSTLSKITSSSSSSSSGTGSDDERWERDRGGYETQRPLVRYHHDPRLSRSSPKISLAAAGWVSSRPGSPARDRYERGFQVVERQSHSAGPSVRDLQFGVQRLGLGMEVVHGPPPPLLPSMSMVLPSSRTPVPRNASFEERNGLALRKRTGISPGHRALTPNSSYGHRPLRKTAQYEQVHVLILTWTFHDLKEADYTAPPNGEYTSLEDETRRLRDTFESYGYVVREYLIPMQRSAESARARIRQFCRSHAADDTLLIVYYHGHGSLDDDNELKFSSHEHPTDSAWSQTAAADLYAAMINGHSCPAHGFGPQYQQLIRKYERYRPVSSIKWEDLRPTILSAAADLLLILDCCAAGAANLRHVNWQPPPQAEGYTKHLFAACGFESSTSDDMTAALCDVLDGWDRDDQGQGQWLTTKRLHQIMEDRLQKDSVGSQPIFKQLLPVDPEQYITLPNLLVGRTREREGARFLMR